MNCPPQSVRVRAGAVQSEFPKILSLAFQFAVRVTFGSGQEQVPLAPLFGQTRPWDRSG
jgi:hypothetical protein